MFFFLQIIKFLLFVAVVFVVVVAVISSKRSHRMWPIDRSIQPASSLSLGTTDTRSSIETLKIFNSTQLLQSQLQPTNWSLSLLLRLFLLFHDFSWQELRSLSVLCIFFFVILVPRVYPRLLFLSFVSLPLEKLNSLVWPLAAIFITLFFLS